MRLCEGAPSRGLALHAAIDNEIMLQLKIG